MRSPRLEPADRIYLLKFPLVNLYIAVKGGGEMGRHDRRTPAQDDSSYEQIGVEGSANDDTGPLFPPLLMAIIASSPIVLIGLIALLVFVVT